MIRAVGRALAIFDAFDSDHLSLSLQEIAERIRMPKTTAFRLVNTLERAGFLVLMDNQQYCQSLKLVRLAGMVRSTISIREIARPVMLEVNHLTSETITLNAAVGSERMVLEVVDTPAPLMSMARPGQHQPMLLGASNRVLMAYMPEAELDKVLGITTAGHPHFDRAALERELARFRRQGYALSRGQRVPGLTAIAVPIFDIHGRVPYCLALTGPSVRVDPRDIDFAEILMAAGRDISSRLGASPSAVTDFADAMASEDEHARRTGAGAAESGAGARRAPRLGKDAAKAEKVAKASKGAKSPRGAKPPQAAKPAKAAGAAKAAKASKASNAAKASKSAKASKAASNAAKSSKTARAASADAPAIATAPD